MAFYTDLHLHSRYSRATSRNCDLPNLALWAQKKGIALLGSGDFTHPAWRREIERQLSHGKPATRDAGFQTCLGWRPGCSIRCMNEEDKRYRRATSRVPLQGMITYRLDGQEYGNLAADVSPDGIFIRTFMPPAIGTRLELTVRLPAEQGGFSVELEGRVRRRVDGEDPRQNGMGIQFTAVHASDADAVRFLVSQIFGCRLPPPEEEEPAPESDPDPEPFDDGDTRPD